MRTDHGEAPAPRIAPWLWGMALLALLPFAVASIPSMPDWPGHVGRYHVMLAAGRSPLLNHFYVFDWHLVGNLGVDLLVRAIGPSLGAERAAWLITATLPVLTIAGIVLVARAADRRVGPAAAIAACLVFGNPLLFGFVNFCLAQALALIAFAAWIRLRERPVWLHLSVLAPLGFVVWLAHAMGWGALVLLAIGFELERVWSRRAALVAAIGDAALRGLALMPPLVATLAWRSGGAGAAFGYGDELLQRKLMNWVVVLRGGSPVLDIGTVLLLGALVLLLAWRGKWRVDWRIGNGAVLLILACLFMPTTVFASWGADERLAPLALMMAALALRWRGTVAGGMRIVRFATLLFALRIGAIAWGWHTLDAQYRSNLAALDSVPRGSRIAALVLTNGCHAGWRKTAYPHLPALAIVRRDALVNAEWPMTGAPLLRVIYPLPDALRYDPSQMIDAYDCAGRPTARAIDARLARIGPAQSDYVWMLDTQGRTGLWPGHTPLYHDASSALYSVR
ncbi:hypothetical protein U1872_08935 [Sphingomonas sp. RB3P16]|uniref:hypothetical protein n=1 Tax=Parasphingomonas frigoris TaxID=3096163 RepID=UPI002FC9D46C